MKRLLITGHRGLLGSACVRQLRHQYEILTTGLDLTDESGVEFWFDRNQPDYVIHAAAKVGGVKANRDNPVQFMLENLKIQNSVISAAHLHGVKKLVFIGTSCLYPKSCPLPVKESSLMTGPFEPAVEAYATAKLAGYQLCNAHRAQYGRSFVTACPSNLYGIGDRYGPSAHVIPALIEKFAAAKKEGTPVKIWGSGKAIREFMYADDTADALGLVLESYDSPELINIGTGESTTIYDLAVMIGDAMGFKPTIEWDNNEPTGIPEKTFDISKLKSLGFKPRLDLATGIALTVNDYLTSTNIRQ